MNKKTGSAGIPIPEGEVWIEDQDGKRSIESCEIGEVVYRGSNVSMGYACSQEDFSRGYDWGDILHTKDLGYQDEDGCLVINAPLVHDGVLKTNDRVEMRKDKTTGRQQFRIVGRKDNIIDSGGIKIQIEEVERLLKPHLSVPFMITKTPNKKFGEVVVLLCGKPFDGVSSSSSDSMLSEEELRNICTKVLPPYWAPKKYVFVDKLPMTETGKPARAEAEKLVRDL